MQLKSQCLMDALWCTDFVQDLHFFVTTSDDEKKLIIATVQGLYYAVCNLLKQCLYFILFSNIYGYIFHD